jgi:flagellar basal-body rod modification protein FlgD
MDINLASLAGGNAASNATGEPQDRGVNTDKEAFLKLLVAQVSQQDPMSPQDSDQYVQQLTQFSTLEQLMSLNKGVETLALGQMSNNSQEALRFVGRNVVARGDQLTHDQGDYSEISYEVKGDASEALLTIRDAYGDVVYETDVRSDKGVQRFTWDGRGQNGQTLPSGRYTVSIEAQAGGDTVPVDTYVKGEVTGVRFDQGYPEMMIGDRRVRMTEVIEVK